MTHFKLAKYRATPGTFLEEGVSLVGGDGWMDASQTDLAIVGVVPLQSPVIPSVFNTSFATCSVLPLLIKSLGWEKQSVSD